jgi:exonuclease III
MGLTDVYRTFHPKIPQYTFFSAEHGTFAKHFGKQYGDFL